jgi:hypothetical protein
LRVGRCVSRGIRGGCRGAGVGCWVVFVFGIRTNVIALYCNMQCAWGHLGFHLDLHTHTHTLTHAHHPTHAPTNARAPCAMVLFLCRCRWEWECMNAAVQVPHAHTSTLVHARTVNFQLMRFCNFTLPLPVGQYQSAHRPITQISHILQHPKLNIEPLSNAVPGVHLHL